MLDDTLRNIRESVEGVRAVWLVGLDGIPVAGSAEPAFGRADDIAATYADLLRKARAANGELERPEPFEIIVGDAEGSVVVRSVTGDYAFLGIIAPGGSLGRLRFEFRRACPGVAAEVEG